MRSKKDGQTIPGSKRTISREEQLRALDIDATKPKPAPLPPTPNQARRAMSDDWRGDDLDPPDFERSVVTDPEAIARAYGLRPEDFDAAPLGSQPEGQPIAQARRPRIERPAYPEDGSAEPSAPVNPEDAALALQAATGEAKRLLAEARATGNPDPETLRAGMKLAERLARGLAKLKSK
jgi:hypothetical protein